jgi:anti-anti-sigma regulatory factor
MLKIQRTTDQVVVFILSGRLKAENMGELSAVIGAEPEGQPLVLDLTDLTLVDRDAVRFLRDCEACEHIVLRNCPPYIRAWMAHEAQ